MTSKNNGVEDKHRGTWKISPIQRVKQSKKGYNRKKDKKQQEYRYR